MAYQSVYDAWIDFNKNKEGYLNYMYVDQKNLVTTGMGNLIDPIGAALALPWKDANGNPASQAAIIDAWNTIKNAGAKGTGGGSQGHYTSLRLLDKDVRSLITTKLQQMEGVLREHYPSYDSWPADAQMGLLSMAWAMGPAFNFPRFAAAANQSTPDFLTMAQESFIPELGSADGGRNQDNNSLFANAANVLATGANPSALYWPGIVVKTATRGILAAVAGFFLAGLGLVGYDWAVNNLKTTKQLGQTAIRESKELLK